jgi:hypothetical protein
VLVSTGDPVAAVPELDDCHDLYESLTGAVADADLMCADVRARRGLALAMLGQAASAIVDASSAVLAYLDATARDPGHSRWCDLARVLSVNAAVLARRGDRGLAVASAAAALSYYESAAQRSPSQGQAEAPGYLHTAAAVSALFNLAAGRLTEGYLPALVIVSSLEPGTARDRLEAQLGLIARLLARSEETNQPITGSAELGRALAESLIPELQGRNLLWVPDATPPKLSEPPGTSWPGGALPPTLEEALSRHAAGTADEDLIAGLAAGQPRELVWTASMRWPRRRLAYGQRLAELAVEALPRAYADGLRLALDAHALLAAGHQQRNKTATTAPGEYLPTWRRLLAETAAACRAAGDDALAEDLAGLEAAIG